MKPNAAKTLPLLASGLRLDPEPGECRLQTLDMESWLAVIQLANAHLVTPALADALKDHGTLATLPSEVRSYLSFVLEQNAKRNAALTDQALELIRQFGAAGISPLFLKGALNLVEAGDRAPGIRMMVDIDIAVPPTARDKAVDQLLRAGYQVADRYPDGHHAISEFMRPGEPGAVDLHLELIDQSYVLPASEVWDRSCRIVDPDGGIFHVPSATDRVMHLLLHAQIHYRGNFYCGRLRLGNLHDFARLAVAHADSIDWNLIVGRLRQFRLMTPLLSYLLAAKTLFGLPWPIDESPTFSARAHFRRCLVQMRYPKLDVLGMPWGNLRSAFAAHRMQVLYTGHGRGLLRNRSHHAWQFLQHHGTIRSMKRLFRA